MIKQKKAVAIHDISCVGRCSLTVALPIISAAGVDTSIMPTAVLSTHTGGFTGYTYRDLTEDLMPIAEHWKSLNLDFDSIYTGFLGSFEQIDIVKKIVTMFRKPEQLVVVDPAMADEGKLYGIFPEAFPTKMRELCAMADVIIPNITEAALMLGEEYVAPPYTKEYIEGLLHRIAGIGCNKIVLTGVCFDNEKLGAAAFDSVTDEINYSFAPAIEGYYHGTGDVFGSALVAGLLTDHTIAESAEIAVTYTQKTIELTAQTDRERRFGVCFEMVLPELIERLKK